jgi:hypothetical protein
MADTALLTTNQSTFVKELQSQTGLDTQVLAAWVLAEESGSAARQRQTANNNDWLNIGYTGAGTFGAGAAIWKDPIQAADATAQWMRGQHSIPGYGTASHGIQAILSSASASPQQQIAAIQNSGWATSRYPSLGSLYNQVYNSIATATQLAEPFIHTPSGQSPQGAAASAVGGAASSVAGELGSIGSSIGDIASLVTSGAFWLRVGEVIAGALLVFLGLHALIGRSSSVGDQAKTVTRVVPVPV